MKIDKEIRGWGEKDFSLIIWFLCFPPEIRNACQ
jgi:hypothetical protein